MSDDPKYCPVHGDPADPLRAWPCPVAVEGDPPEVETCPHFVDELLRRSDEVAVKGHYFQHHKDEEGLWWSQEYRDHQPHGDPRPILRRTGNGA